MCCVGGVCDPVAGLIGGSKIDRVNFRSTRTITSLRVLHIFEVDTHPSDNLRSHVCRSPLVMTHHLHAQEIISLKVTRNSKL